MRSALRIFWVGLKGLGLWGALDQATLAGSGLLITVMVARSGGPSALGAFVVAQSAVLLVAGLLKAGFGDPILIEVRGQGDRTGLSAAPPLVVALGALGFLLAVVWWLAGPLFGMPVPSTALLLLVALLPLAALYEVARSIRLADGGEWRLFIGDIFVATGRIGALGLVWVGVRGVELGLAALAGGGLASVLSITQWLRRSWTLAPFGRLWQLGRWLTGESLLYGLGNYGVWLLAVPRAGADIAGELRASQQLFAPVQVVLVGLNVVMLGRLAATGGRLSGSARLLGLVQLVMIGLWSFVLITAGPTLTGLLFGDRFEPSRGELAILAMSTTVTAIYTMAGQRLQASRLVRILFGVRAVATVTALATALIIGTSFVGVVAAFLASQLIGAVLAWWAWKVNHVRLTDPRAHLGV
jgi:O-antigen/teichoic acid export membrane protein